MTIFSCGHFKLPVKLIFLLLLRRNWSLFRSFGEQILKEQVWLEKSDRGKRKNISQPPINNISILLF